LSTIGNHLRIEIQATVPIVGVQGLEDIFIGFDPDELTGLEIKLDGWNRTAGRD
jgi:hypothetical protein